MRIYILILILLLSSPVFAKEPYKDIETYGKCSPIIEGNNNKTTVNCYDIDPRANNQLNELLDKNLKLSQSLNKNLELLQKIKEAEEWAKRYHDLEESLKAMGDDDTDAKNALGLIKEGELDKAGAILDKILKKQESQGDKTAENQYNRGQLFLMQYKPLDALPHLEKALHVLIMPHLKEKPNLLIP
ncbi:MAG: tetratricopeptide repeat protein, partial [Nitrospirae bacterium]|nr:tetratricopeptide repeat protein [Nitrospirota bacterium]